MIGGLILASGSSSAEDALREEATGTGDVRSSLQSSSVRYRYLLLDTPAGVDYWDVRTVLNDRTVIGNGWSCVEDTEYCVPTIVKHKNGVSSVAKSSAVANDSNQSGAIGAGLVTDVDLFIQQAAIIKGGKVELIPRLSGEYTSHVRKLTDSGIAYVVSTTEMGETTHYLYENGKKTFLTFPARAIQLNVSDNGLMSGTLLRPGLPNSAFRMNTKNGESSVLAPQPTEPHSWGQGIHDNGDVLGYSFVGGGLERIGVWDNKNVFTTYFVEGTPEFPTVSNKLLWNQSNFIVITDAGRNDLNSYIVPKPGVRIKLADAVEGGALPPWTLIMGVNDRGDLTGVGGSQAFYFEYNFLLERTDD
jgi:hypothetical protein